MNRGSGSSAALQWAGIAAVRLAGSTQGPKTCHGVSSSPAPSPPSTSCVELTAVLNQENNDFDDDTFKSRLAKTLNIDEDQINVKSHRSVSKNSKKGFLSLFGVFSMISGSDMRCTNEENSLLCG